MRQVHAVVIVERLQRRSGYAVTSSEVVQELEDYHGVEADRADVSRTASVVPSSIERNCSGSPTGFGRSIMRSLREG